jgi:hypothetical protein
VGDGENSANNRRMSEPAYPVGRVVAPQILKHLSEHRAGVEREVSGVSKALLPDVTTIETMIEAAFWASLRREEGYSPKISLAFLPPSDDVSPLLFAQPLALDPVPLTRLAPAVERPGIHLGVWHGRELQQPGPSSEHLLVWGTTRTIPPFCFVVEVSAPGLLVVKHRPRRESGKFVNIAVLEGDRAKVVDERASSVPDCPGVLTSILRFESTVRGDTPNLLVQIAISMRSHGRGGALLVVPSGSEEWRQSIVQPITYAVEPPFAELATMMDGQPSDGYRHEWAEALDRAIEALAGLTVVDGATVITDRYELLAFGAKIRRRRGSPPVEQVLVTEPIEGNVGETVDPGRLGGTRHLSAAQFVHDQRDTLALVASQDGRFTVLAWSESEQTVHAHRMEVLLL